MTKFKLILCKPDQPLNEDPFFAWLQANAKKGDSVSDIDRKMDYLESLGFTKGEDKVTDDELKHLKYVLEAWYYSTPYESPMTLDDCFYEGGDYFVKGLGSRKCITLVLKQAVENAGWIYEVEPSTTYFEIIGDRLFAKYQQIIGSRFICNLKGE